jgi:hypothetical protein
MAREKVGPSISKSALLLSPCITWANPKSKWYEEKYTDTSDRDLGIEFHSLIDSYLKGKPVGKEPGQDVSESGGMG